MELISYFLRGWSCCRVLWKVKMERKAKKKSVDIWHWFVPFVGRSLVLFDCISLWNDLIWFLLGRSPSHFGPRWCCLGSLSLYEMPFFLFLLFCLVEGGGWNVKPKKKSIFFLFFRVFVVLFLIRVSFLGFHVGMELFSKEFWTIEPRRFGFLPSFTGFYRVLPGFTGFCRLLPWGFEVRNRAVAGFTGLHLTLPDAWRRWRIGLVVPSNWIVT